MPRLEGLVGIVNADDESLNCLYADVVCLKENANGKEYYDVRLRGTETVLHLPRENLVELLKRSDDLLITCERMRNALRKAAQTTPESEHLQQKLLALRFRDQLTHTILRHTAPSGWDPLPEEQARRAVVLCLETYYIEQGLRIDANARGQQTTSFFLAMRPFYKHLGEGRIASQLSSISTGDSIAWCRNLFQCNSHSSKLDSYLVFRAFAYAQHRMNFQEQQSTCLDAFCVSFCMVQLLQTHDMDQTMFLDYGTKELALQQKDVLWSFCKLFLDIAILVRERLDERSYRLLLPVPYGDTHVEQAKIAELMVKLRPESPASYLAKHISLMDTKEYMVHSNSWYDEAYKTAVIGKEKADCVGDPFYQHTFGLMVSFWLPTDVCKTPFKVGEIKEKLRQANEHKRRCESYIPYFFFSQAKQYKGACESTLEALNIPDDMILPKMSAFMYTSFRFDHQYFKPGGKFDGMAERHLCAHCAKQLLQLQKCGRCKKVFYCSRTCQVAHWKTGHKKSCKPTKDL